MEKQFAEAIQQVKATLETEGIEKALLSIKNFFGENQESIKEYFDSKTLDETKAEMKTRITEITEELSPIAKKKPAEVQQFVELVGAFFQEEFEYREREVKEGQ